MINKIKNRIEKEIPLFLRYLDASFGLKKVSPLLFSTISEFVSRKGKRARPILFVAGYLGFGDKEPEGLYRSALSLELLHDFMLVHDDIIDKSELRRGLPSVHTAFNCHLRKFADIKFSGQDLAIVAGDVMYAMGLSAFLSVQAPLAEKEKAFKKLIEAAIYTGFGEFIELLSGTKDISSVTKDTIYKIYDYKTAYYTFASPLAMGALLAGAGEKQADAVFRYGIYVGRAFQIKDDILGVFAEEHQIGKSVITDLQEAKKTILVWQACRNADAGGAKTLKKLLGKNDLSRHDLLEARKIIRGSGALDYAREEIDSLIKDAKILLASSTMKPKYKEILADYTSEILKVTDK